MTEPAYPAAMLRLMSRAQEHGWRWRVRAAQGEWKSRAIEVVVLWLMRDPVDGEPESIVAAWENGKFSSAWQAWVPDPEVGGVSPRRIGSRELTAAVTS